MRINDVLRNKGSHEVFTMRPDVLVAELVQVLAEQRIGAMVVSADGTTVLGIVSERDIVQGLAKYGPGVLEQPISALMTADVVTCKPDQSVHVLLAVMTERRFRHVPVVEVEAMTGLVSIGDLVKARIDELAAERDQLEAYIHA